VGHLLGASGSIEAAAAVLSLHHGFVPGTLRVAALEPGLGFELVLKARHQALRNAASLNMGFGGHNVCVAFRQP
jgi:3-oxoacyl-[acyl-carrier-protein] synthase II